MTRGTVRQVRNATPGHASDGYGRVFRYASSALVAIWHGGEYIDLYPSGTPRASMLNGDGSPFDCFNVWDHEHDRPTIDRTAEGFRRYMDERMSTARVVHGGFPGEVWIRDDDES